jgi:3-oxoadipate enol-lactonase
VVELNYSRVGSGPPILLLHPVGLDLTCWNDVTSALAVSFSVIRGDLRGHGHSALGDATDINGYATDVVALLDRLELPSVPVIGVSFGGMIAQTLALKATKRVSALVASACPSAIPTAAQEAIRNRGVAAQKEGMAAILDETLKRWFSEPFLRSGAAERYRQRLLTDRVEAWAAAWNAISNFDITDQLQEIRIPTLCIAARNDLATSLDAMRTLASGMPGATLEIIEDAPHMCHIEQPARFAQLVHAFLTRSLPR